MLRVHEMLLLEAKTFIICARIISWIIHANCNLLVSTCVSSRSVGNAQVSDLYTLLLLFHRWQFCSNRNFATEIFTSRNSFLYQFAHARRKLLKEWNRLIKIPKEEQHETSLSLCFAWQHQERPKPIEMRNGYDNRRNLPRFLCVSRFISVSFGVVCISIETMNYCSETWKSR